MGAVRRRDDGGIPTPVELVSVPRADDEFVSWLDHLARMAGDLRSVTPDYFELMVRGRYPVAIVQPHDLPGAADAATTVWYVYRDGAPSGLPEAPITPAPDLRAEKDERNHHA